jgi:hypothetical protein
MALGIRIAKITLKNSKKLPSFNISEKSTGLEANPS